MLSGRIFLSRVVKAGRMSQTDMSERRRLIDWKASPPLSARPRKNPDFREYTLFLYDDCSFFCSPLQLFFGYFLSF